MKHRLLVFLAACWLLPGALADDQSVTSSNPAPQVASPTVSPSAKKCPKCQGEMELGTCLDVAYSEAFAETWIPVAYDSHKRGSYRSERQPRNDVKENRTFVCKSCGFAEAYFKFFKR